MRCVPLSTQCSLYSISLPSFRIPYKLRPAFTARLRAPLPFHPKRGAPRSRRLPAQNLSVYTHFCPTEASTLSAPFRRPLGCPASRAIRRLQRSVGGYSDRTDNVAEKGLVALLAEGSNHLLLGHLPHRVGRVQRLLTFQADTHQPRPAVPPGAHLQQAVPDQRLEVSAQRGAVHSHPLGQPVDRRLSRQPARHQQGELRGLEAAWCQRRIVELGYRARGLAKVCAGASPCDLMKLGAAHGSCLVVIYVHMHILTWPRRSVKRV